MKSDMKNKMESIANKRLAEIERAQQELSVVTRILSCMESIEKELTELGVELDDVNLFAPYGNVKIKVSVVGRADCEAVFQVMKRLGEVSELYLVDYNILPKHALPDNNMTRLKLAPFFWESNLSESRNAAVRFYLQVGVLRCAVYVNIKLDRIVHRENLRVDPFLKNRKDPYAERMRIERNASEDNYVSGKMIHYSGPTETFVNYWPNPDGKIESPKDVFGG